MTKDEELAALIEQVRKLPPMTAEERKEQACSFAFGNMALMSRYHNATEEELDELWNICRRAAGLNPAPRVR